MMRIPAVLGCDGERLVGTVHEPARDAAPLAVLILNAGPAPRAGNAGFSARLGDALAREGVRTHRFDQSGTGDSTGESWRTLDECRAESQRGTRALAEVRAMVDLVVSRPGVEGVIVGGLCAGATLAMRVAAERPRAVAGVVVIEPDLRRKAPDDSWRERLRKRARALRAPLERLPLVGARLRGMRAAMRTGLDGALALRDPIDPPLAAIWRATLSRRVPVLAVTALDLDADRDLDELLATIADPRGGGGPTTTPDRRRIGGANHLFTAEGAAEAAIDAIRAWSAARARGAAATEAPAASSPLSAPGTPRSRADRPAAAG
ncbi:MAG: hypothetical protein RIS86_1899 [Planctomycetota bacterium]